MQHVKSICVYFIRIYTYMHMYICICNMYIYTCIFVSM